MNKTRREALQASSCTNTKEKIKGEGKWYQVRYLD